MPAPNEKSMDRWYEAGWTADPFSGSLSNGRVNTGLAIARLCLIREKRIGSGGLYVPGKPREVDRIPVEAVRFLDNLHGEPQPRLALKGRPEDLMASYHLPDRRLQESRLQFALEPEDTVG